MNTILLTNKNVRTIFLFANTFSVVYIALLVRQRKVRNNYRGGGEKKKRVGSPSGWLLVGLPPLSSVSVVVRGGGVMRVGSVESTWSE